MEFMGFDINTADTPKPWGPREEQMVQDVIQTVVGDTLGYSKRTSGHLHNKLYSAIDVPAFAAYVNEEDNILDIGCYGYNHQMFVHAPVNTQQAISMSVSSPGGSEDVVFRVDSVSGSSRTVIKSPFSSEALTLSESGDVYTKGPKIDISSQCVPTGWLITTERFITYQTIGSLLCLKIYIDGTSESNIAELTIPFVPYTQTVVYKGSESLGHLSFQSDLVNGVADCTWEGTKLIFSAGPSTDYLTTWSPTGRKKLCGVLTFLIENPHF